MRLIKLVSLLSVFFFGLAVDASAAPFYVSNTGSNSNPGSLSQPWLTIQHAVNTISPGDTIIVQPGTYAGCRITRSGSAGAVFTLRAATPGTVLINTLSPANRHQSLIEVENFDATVRYWVIDGFELSGAQRYGVDLRDTQFITVQNCSAHNSGLTGIFLAFCYNPLIQNNESFSNGEHGIYQSNSGDSPIIRGNRLHHNSAAGLHMNGDRNFTPGDGIISFAVVEKNVVWENGRNGGSGINCDGVSDSVIRNNLLYNNHASGISLYAIDGSEGSSRNNVYNNTILMPSDGRWCINIPASTEGQTNPVGNKIKNNILYNAHSFRGSVSVYAGGASGFESNYNVVVGRFSTDGGSTTRTLAQWQALGYDLNSIVATPSQLFTDPASLDYSLKSGAPAIDAGVALTDVIDDILGATRPQGNQFDIGCYEKAAAIVAPVADFTSTPLNGAAPLFVQFTDTSTGPPASWSWEFGDGTTSTLQNPSHTFATVGTFMVKLTASNSLGSSIKVVSAVVTSGGPLPVADFTANPVSGTAPLSVQFTDLSTDAASWSWTFGDGGTSTQRNPVHVYQQPGSYNVSLTATNTAGQNVRSKPSFINVTQPAVRELFCASATITVGRLSSGTHHSVHSSNNSYLVVRSATVDGRMGTVITYSFNVSGAVPSTLSITSESRVSVRPQRQRLMLFNFSAGLWETVDDRSLTGSGDVTTQVDVSNAARFINAGEVRLQVRTGDTTSSKWRHQIDLIRITAQ